MMIPNIPMNMGAIIKFVLNKVPARRIVAYKGCQRFFSLKEAEKLDKTDAIEEDFWQKQWNCI